MRRHPEGKGSDSTMRKTPHRAPAYEELDPATIFFSLFYWQSVTQMVTTYDMKLVFVQKITFLLRKINTNRCQQNCIVRLQYAPNCLSAGALLGELTSLPRLYLRGLCLKKGEGRGKGNTRRGDEMMGEQVEERGKKERKGMREEQRREWEGGTRRQHQPRP